LGKKKISNGKVVEATWGNGFYIQKRDKEGLKLAVTNQERGGKITLEKDK